MPIVDIDKNAQWQAGNATIATIVKEGFGGYLRRLPNHDLAFRLDDLAIVCIDGRTHGEVCLAGSGILLGLDGALRFAEEAQKRYGKIEAITWHDDCGAAVAYAKKHHKKDASACAEKFAREFAARLGVEARWIANTGQDGFHSERVIYYDGTGRFNWARVSGLPVGLTISRAYLGFNEDYAKSELALALGITLTPHTKGGHGFGEKFTEREPLLVVIVANSHRELEKLTAEAQDVIDVLPGANQRRVNLDGFVWTSTD